MILLQHSDHCYVNENLQKNAAFTTRINYNIIINKGTFWITLTLESAASFLNLFFLPFSTAPFPQPWLPLVSPVAPELPSHAETNGKHI